MKKWSITGMKILKSGKLIKNGTLTISNGKISNISNADSGSNISLEIDDGVMVPGLINSHDHLLGTYHPKVGKGPYENWLPWDNDLKSSPVYQERQQIENLDLYLLGGYRNLLSGVTTVSDHIPHFVGDPFYDILPMKAIKKFALAHSIASFALQWGDGVAEEYKKATKSGIPFVTHIAEGFDNETIDDLATLDKQGGLGDHSVLVHGIAFSESDMKLIKKNNASVVWCGDSNIFMFNKTTNIEMLLDLGINVCIGTDSPMSGGENLLSEMKFDKNFFQEHYDEELPDELIYKMVTEHPAKALKQKKIGYLKEGYIADLVVFQDQGSVATSVVSAELSDVKLVVIDGKPVYGEAEYSHIFDALGVKYQHILLDGIDKIIVGDLTGLLKRISRAVGFKKEFSFIPVKFEF